MPSDTPFSQDAEHGYDAINSLYLRYQDLADLEKHKNKVIEDLVLLCKNKEDLYRQEAKALSLEIEANRNPQTREMKLQDTIKQMKALMDTQSFVLVLVDGNQITFRDELLRQGEEGGKEAAIYLWNAVHGFIVSHPDIPSTSQVIARIYANAEVLAEKFLRSGILTDKSSFDDFTRGFTTLTPLFDFVNVPGPEEVVRGKIESTFLLNVHDCHCRRLIFGSANSSELYNSLLFHAAKDPKTFPIVEIMDVANSEEVSVVESSGFTKLFQVAKADKSYYYHRPGRSLMASTTPEPTTKIDETYYHQPERSSIASTTPKLPTPSEPVLSPKDFPSLPPAQVASINGSTASSSPAPTWASTAARPYHTITPLVFPTIKNKSTAQAPLIPTTILRNRKGQRIDPAIPCTRDETQRVKNMKLCNVHFLRNDCPHGKNCTHIHAAKPTNAELQILRHVARYAPCLNGSACDEVKCIYGHVCPAAEGRHDKCAYGASCRFPEELHGIDKTPVKTVKV